MSMEVVLFDDVKNLGRQGGVVKVADGYFRNYLEPNSLAAPATPANMKRYDKMKKKQLELAAVKLSEARELVKKIDGVSVSIKAKAGESDRLFGSITAHDIADALNSQGYHVDKKQIDLHEHIKTLGIHDIIIHIHAEVDGKIKLHVERA
ncbi:MAG: 50S ribosomal protein L9 [Candidatus Sumerlaeota bacterium]|nr:50S ribosomal protein L9 [Candidatus Sumerlaeota bacterium]